MKVDILSLPSRTNNAELMKMKTELEEEIEVLKM